MKTALQLVDRGLLPKPLIRQGIRKLLRDRLDEQRSIHGADREASLLRWVEHMRDSAVAEVPDLANKQHYEVPAEFYEQALGQRLKYSSAYYASESTTLDEAEEAMLALTCERAGLDNGQEILELGCGWGSLTLWMAEAYPDSRITAVSNSSSQREHILARAALQGLDNVQVLTCDMNEFDTAARFDRVVSVEMFEHMRNWERLLERVRSWLREDGALFLHVFSHHKYAYPFEVQDETDWMSEHFFSGGMMPCHDLVNRLEIPFEVDDSWVVPGTHYGRTAEDWLVNIEERKERVLEIFSRTYGADEANRWFQRWRVFFLSCAELFNYDGGREWHVSHLRLRPRAAEL